MREAQVVEERKKLAAEAIKAEEEAEARRLAEAQVAEKALAEAIESECADDSGGWGWGEARRRGRREGEAGRVREHTSGKPTGDRGTDVNKSG